MSNNIGYLGTTAPGDLSSGATPSIQRGQVYLATHNAEDEKLSTFARSFISFSWGGRDIEDFGFIVVSSDDRYEKDAYGEFEDSTTELQVIDGQYFWRSHFIGRSLSLSLSTDGVEEAQLQDFKNWFRPGIRRKLILAEASNRYIWARIKEIPTFSILPFEHEKDITIGGTTYTAKTTIWRGDLTLEFVMDDPIWTCEDDCYTGDSLSNDQLRAIVEDGIPHIDMFDIPDNTSCKILLANNKVLECNNGVKEIKENAFDLNESLDTYLYYCGTYPTRPILTFDFVPTWNAYNNGNGLNPGVLTDRADYRTEASTQNIYYYPYVINPKGSFIKEATSLFNQEVEYSYIALVDNKNEVIKKFEFTTPSIFTSYNQLVKTLFISYSAGDSMVDLKNTLKSVMNDTYSRMWALAICELAMDTNWASKMNLCDSTTSALSENFNTNFLAYFNKMFHTKEEGGNTILDPEHHFTCTFDSRTGLAQIVYNINMIDLSLKETASSFDDLIRIDTTIQESEENTEYETILVKENVGDMVRSNYLTIDSRTLPNEQNKITLDNCLKIISNCSLTNVSLKYEYMYL